MNRFLPYLIQNKDEIAGTILMKFSSEKMEKFWDFINDFNEYEVFYFYNLDVIDMSDFDTEDFYAKFENNNIILDNANLQLLINLTAINSIYCDIKCDDHDLNFDNIEKIEGSKVSLILEDKFRQIFMTELQMKSNFEYLNKIIGEFLSIIDLDECANKINILNILETNI